MVVSMDVPPGHRDNEGHETGRQADRTYEDHSREYESTGVMIGSPPDVDISTPLASESNPDSPETTVQNEDLSPASVVLSETQRHEDKNQLRAASVRHAGPNFTSTSMEGYFPPQHNRSSSTRRAFGPHASSTQSSSGSLQALSEHEGFNTVQSPIRRAVSTRSSTGPGRTRSTSHSKISSLSQLDNKRMPYSDGLIYPEQSLASLQAPITNVRPYPILRTRSSHPAQNLLFNEMSKMNRTTVNSGIRTADNTPISSPGLFTPSSMRHPTLSDSRLNNAQLHHLQTPKETHTAEIEHDVFSGNKFINNYEVIGELGRGEHGKVKLGRDMERNSTLVAIKIVPRYSTRRRLGKLGAPEDRTKREVAILKKARHPNVVSLLEVIDDPNKNKVYLILEYVDKGEIKWRKHGVKEILAINNQRFEQERLGINLGTEPTERDAHIVHLAHVRHDRLEQMRRYNQGLTHVPNWSLEYAGETDDESEVMEMCRSMSRQYSHIGSPARGNSQDDHTSPTSEPPLAGTMYGSYIPEMYRNRKFSIAASAVSHMSSEMNFEQDDDQRSFVPALTLEEARRAFRDTLLGLEFLHFIGIIHRDIKPANLLVQSGGGVKISDFGVSYLGRPITEEELENRQHEGEATRLDDEKELARSVGTPAFWAPELCYGSTDMFADKKEPKITGALDLWALGITLYCMIYARLPFYHNETMGLHEAVCKVEVVCPRTRLVAVDTTSSEHISRPTHSINSNKRLDYELKFEPVPEALRDIINKLLTKDPAYRITIAEAKKHLWVTEGLSDTEDFLQNPEIAKESRKKILEMSDKEIDRAVVKRNFIEKISTTAGRIVGSLLGRKDTRKRASTTASSAGSSSESLHSPAGSSTSTVGKTDKIRDTRRASLRGDELLQALKASRDPSEHHPLAQSQTASPDSKGSPDQALSPGYFDHNMKAASTGATPQPDFDRPSRPRGPDRAASALSTADSVKTIRPSHRQRSLGPGSTFHTDLSYNEQSLRARVEGLWEGTTKTLNRLASRDRRHAANRSRSQSRPPSESDGHAGPSLAVSNTYAAGAFQTPNALRAVDLKDEGSRKTSITSLDDDMPRHSTFRAPSSDRTEFEQAQQVNQRRQIQEALDKAAAATKKVEAQSFLDSCPPSPDDLTFADAPTPHSNQMSPENMITGSIPTAVSASTIASSLDGYGNSSVSQSVSNPSIGIISGSSSPPGDNFLSEDVKPSHTEITNNSADTELDCMKTADTVTFHGRPATPTAMGKPLQAEQEYFDDGDDEDDDYSSDEEGIVMMGGLKK